MTLEEFKDFVKTGKPLDTEEIHQFMDKMGGEARKNHFPAELRLSYSGGNQGHLVRAFRESRPLHAPCIPAVLYRFRQEHRGGRGCVHQRLLPFPGPWRRTHRGRMPDRAQCGVCHAQPFSGAGEAQDDLFRTYRLREERLGGLQRHYPARRDYRRQCRDRCRGGRYGRYTC